MLKHGYLCSIRNDCLQSRYLICHNLQKKKKKKKKKKNTMRATNIYLYTDKKQEQSKFVKKIYNTLS